MTFESHAGNGSLPRARDLANRHTLARWVFAAKRSAVTIVSTPQFEEMIGRKLYITVILRLLMSSPRDSGRTLEYGEIVDRDGHPVARFVGWQGLLPSVQDFVSRQVDEDE